jgi:tetratricopeptide (TPR) repeat protein
MAPAENAEPLEGADAHYERAMASLLAGHAQEALADLDRCLTLAPDHAPAYSARAGIHLRAGRHEAALSDIEEALRIRPDHLGDLHNRAVVLAAMGRPRPAIRDYEAVIAGDPDSAGSYNNLAWILATAEDPALRDGKKAVAYARKAVEKGDNPVWLDTLAAAHAECGDFASAVAAAREAYRLSDPPSESILRRMEIYEGGQSLAEWREARPGDR